jgi:hypothetical protein
MNKQAFKLRYGPWALVTGAARGLGAEFARQLAQLELDLVLIDQYPDELEAVAAPLRAAGRQVRGVRLDLAEADLLEQLAPHTAGLEIGLLVCNAAYGPVGDFFERSLDDDLRAVAVNVQAPLRLVHAYGAPMIARRRGGIILLSSMSAQQGTALVANYAATKAYNQVLAESLWAELGPHGVDALAVLPGSTHTPGFLGSQPNLKNAPLVNVMEAGPAVAEALGALGRGPNHTPGWQNRLASLVIGRLLPRRWAIRLFSENMLRLYAGRIHAAD